MITIDLLKSWHPCAGGFNRFCELYPNGADLYTAAHGLKDDGHPDWGMWLYDKARQNKLFEDVTKDGFANTGDQNTGHRNTGHWNTGDQNTGFFNTITPGEILIFNKPCNRSVFESAYMPRFLYFSLTYWVDESEMTDEDKSADPNFYMRGGQLRKRDYKEAFRMSWDAADPEDRMRIKDIPNFDAQVFFEISGIDLR